jgi:ATP-dependent DNA helicase RecQ
LFLKIDTAEGEDEKNVKLKEFLRQQATGIIYSATTTKVDQLEEMLRGSGFKVGKYHGKMSGKSRSESQERFMSNDIEVMIATNAFGLGIDKPDIRFVAHYHLPGSIEAYYQEIGRAGRDGEAAHCFAFHDPGDRKLQRFLQAGSYPDDGDLVNAYHALTLLCKSQDLVATDQLLAASPLSKSRMKVCLALFEGKGIIHRKKRGYYTLLRDNLTRDDVAKMGQSYRERQERQTIRLQQTHEYADSVRCRWQYLLAYFDETGDGETSCGHCDQCA